MQVLTYRDNSRELPPRLRGLTNITFQQTRQSSAALQDCSNSLQPADMAEEPLQWQPVTSTTGSVFVYSAFFDSRWSSPIVVIIALVSDFLSESSRKRLCRMWFRNEDKPYMVSADFQLVPEHHNRM